MHLSSKEMAENIEIQTDAYYNEVENKIVAMPTQPVPLDDDEPGMVEIRGVDVAIQSNWKLPKEISIDARLTYTYQKAQDFTNNKWLLRRSDTTTSLA